MTYQVDGLVDFSLSVSHIEMALYDYATSPQLGLEKLQSTLMSFLAAIDSIASFHDVFYQRFSPILSRAEYLLGSGFPYFERYNIAFISVCDALFQVVIASQFGMNRVQQLYLLLFIGRLCWAALISAKNEVNYSLVYTNYETQLEPECFSKEQAVDAYLKVLLTAGRVSFHLDSIQEVFFSGRCKLFSVQPIEWLQLCFPNFEWRAASTSQDKFLRALCELIRCPMGMTCRI